MKANEVREGRFVARLNDGRLTIVAVASHGTATGQNTIVRDTGMGMDTDPKPTTTAMVRNTMVRETDMDPAREPFMARETDRPTTPAPAPSPDTARDMVNIPATDIGS